MRVLVAAWKLLLDLLYPRKCVFCCKLLARKDGDICAACYRALPEPQNPVRKGAYFSSCVSALVYDDFVREAVLRFKFAGREHYAKSVAPLIAAALVRNSAPEVDVVTWTPISRERMRSRGYDQGECLAREVAKLMQVPCERLLRKNRDNPAQSGLKAAQRKANVLGVYSAVHPDKISGKRILLMDDVITTGSTLSECSRVLRLAGADSVSCATLAQAEGKGKQVEL